MVSSTHGTTWIERSPPERGARQTAVCVPHMSNAHGWYVEQTRAPVADARICRNPRRSGQHLGSVTLAGFSGPVFSLLCLLAADRAFKELLFGCKAVLAGITPAPGRSSFPRESLLPKQWQETEGPSRLRVAVPASRPGGLSDTQPLLVSAGPPGILWPLSVCAPCPHPSQKGTDPSLLREHPLNTLAESIKGQKGLGCGEETGFLLILAPLC